jgi:hypothetical protein
VLLGTEVAKESLGLLTVSTQIDRDSKAYALGSKEYAELGRAVQLVLDNEVADLQPEQTPQRRRHELLVDQLRVELGREMHLEDILLLDILLGDLSVCQHGGRRGRGACLLLRLQEREEALAVLVLQPKQRRLGEIKLLVDLYKVTVEEGEERARQTIRRSSLPLAPDLSSKCSVLSIVETAIRLLNEC